MLKLLITILVLLLIVGSGLALYFLFDGKNKNKNKTKSYNGVVLFDVDGTLRGKTLTNNYHTVQTCLDKGFAVGISTANGRYTPETAHMFLSDWLPQNLYDFMKDTNWITFNSIQGNILVGKKISSYSNIPEIKNIKTNNGTYYGYCKGYSLALSGKILGITDPSHMIICDDDSEFIKGIFQYNPKFNVVCAGAICGGDLNKDIMNKALSKCQ